MTKKEDDDLRRPIHPRISKAGLRSRVYPNLIAFFQDPSNPNQNELARELGISKTFMSMIKWREREPSMQLAVDIMNRCHVPLESLIRKVS